MYLGNIPATSFEAVKKDRFTGLTGTGVTLSHSVTNVQDIVVWVNSVKQDYNNYSVNGTALTLGGSLVSADVVQVLYVGRTFQTVNPPADSVGPSQTAPTIITGQTAETSIATDDTILIHDTSASALRKMTRANFVSGIGGTMTPSFSVKKSSNQTIAGTTSTKMELDSEIFDTDNKYDSSTNFRFLPGVAGKYFLSLASSFQNFPSDKIMSVSIKKNGSGLSSFNNISGSYSDDFSAATSVIDEANTTDYYEAFIFHRASSSQTMIGSVSIFSGFKIIE